MFQDPQLMPETAHSTEPYVYYVFFYIYIYVIMFNLKIRYSKRVTIIIK